MSKPANGAMYPGGRDAPRGADPRPKLEVLEEIIDEARVSRYCAPMGIGRTPRIMKRFAELRPGEPWTECKVGRPRSPTLWLGGHGRLPLMIGPPGIHMGHGSGRPQKARAHHRGSG